MRVATYARVSTQEQGNRGLSLQFQHEAGEAFCERFGHDLVAVRSDVRSGKRADNRPGLQEALALLASGESDALWVHKLDRLTRSVADWSRIVDDYFSADASALGRRDMRRIRGCTLVESDRVLDLNDTNTWLLSTMAIVLSEAEVRRGSDRATYTARARAERDLPRGQIPIFKRLNYTHSELAGVVRERFEESGGDARVLLNRIKKVSDDERLVIPRFLSGATSDIDARVLRRVALALGVELALEDDEQQREAFRIIRERRETQRPTPYPAIARELNRLGLPNVNGTPWDRRMCARYLKRGLESSG